MYEIKHLDNFTFNDLLLHFLIHPKRASAELCSALIILLTGDILVDMWQNSHYGPICAYIFFIMHQTLCQSSYKTLVLVIEKYQLIPKQIIFHLYCSFKSLFYRSNSKYKDFPTNCH